MTEQEPRQNDQFATRAFDVLRRRKGIALGIFALVAASAVSFVTSLPDLNRASAMVLVERPLSDAFVRPAISGEVESRLHVIKQEILSRDRLTRLIERFDLYPDTRKNSSIEDALTQMRQDIEVKPEGPEQISSRARTVAFRLSYTGADAKTVADVTNAIATFYVAQNDRMRSEEANRTTEFLKTQLQDVKQQLEKQEGNMRAYTARYIGELPQQVGVNLATLERLNTQLRLNGEQQLKIIEQRETLREQLAGRLAESGAPARAAAATAADTEERTPMSADLMARLSQIERMKQDLAATELRALPGHPDVVRLRDQLTVLEKEANVLREREASARREAERQTASASDNATVGTRGTVPAEPAARRRSIESMDAQLVQLQKEEASTRQTITEYERRLESTPERQQEYGLVSRDYTASKELYDSLLKRYEESQLAASVETDRQGERFRILETAIPPEGPAAPNRMRLLILGVLLAAAAATLVVMAVEQMDPSFRSVDELREFTSVPVLVAIPRIGPSPAAGYVRAGLATVSAVAAIVLFSALSAYLAKGNEPIVRLLERAG
jgi:polysaccharide chain length determinant protein (PEP-CTERM system associated)